jgi:hypothetical protein
MNQNWFDKKDYGIFILGIIFVSFGITIHVGIFLFILLISKKINYFFENYNKTFNTSFYN